MFQFLPVRSQLSIDMIFKTNSLGFWKIVVDLS